jgi:alkylated DNA repair protein (DNA oxidative demethylase)
MSDLFETVDLGEPCREALAPGAWLLRGRALRSASTLLEALEAVAAAAPFRHMITPGGFEMSAAMTSCGAAGWMTDRRGYRYTTEDPESSRAWPAMPEAFERLAGEAAAEAGFAGFVPDSCLINRYRPGARLSLHQDRDEHDFSQPIVSVSLGLPATFQFGGPKRSDPVHKVGLRHGDVVVWGGTARLHYHGVLTLKEGDHPATGPFRYNLTLRKAL